MEYRNSTIQRPSIYQHSWQLWQQIGEYYIWCRGTSDYQTLWNVTKEDIPPSTMGGYYSRDYLLNAKGIRQ